MRYLAILLLLPAIVVPCRSTPTDYPSRRDEYRANFTLEERLTQLTQCLRSKEFPEVKVEQAGALFREVGGEVDGWYLLRALEIINKDFGRARSCICRGAGVSYGTGRAKHCFSEDLETDIVLESCVSRNPYKVLELLPQYCDVPSRVDDKWCCETNRE